MSDWYVSPVAATLTPNGDGSISKPWTLFTAMSGAAGQIKPGDTVWLLPGPPDPTQKGGYGYKPYSIWNDGTAAQPSAADGYSFTVSGNASAPVIFRNYNGLRATIDGKGTYSVAEVPPGSGGYIWFWGLELCDSNIVRTVTADGATSNCWGRNDYAPGVKTINCYVHDTAQGWSSYDAASDGEFCGCIVQYNGNQQTGGGRNRGHGLYAQNNIGHKTIDNCFVIDNANMGVQIYGSPAAHVNGFRVSNTTSANNGRLFGSPFADNWIFAEGGQRKDNQFDNIVSFCSPSNNGPSGDNGTSSFGNWGPGDDLAITNSKFLFGNAGVSVEWQASVKFTGNEIVVRKNPTAPNGFPIYGVRAAAQPGQSTSGWVWDNNKYFGGQGGGFEHGTMSLDASLNEVFAPASQFLIPWSQWLTETGFDKNSSYTDDMPTGVEIVINPNKYETKRAHVTVINWDNSANITLDLSSVLSNGDTFTIQDAQNFYGKPVASGTYGGPVQIATNGFAKAPGSWEVDGVSKTPHTAPLLLTLVVLGPSTTVIPPQPLSISPAVAALHQGQTQQFSASQQVNWSISGNGSIDANGLYTAPSTISAQSTVTVSAKASDNSTATATITLVPPTATVTQTWTVTGSLPPGLSLASNGQISGTPTTAGTYPVTWNVSDSTGKTGLLSQNVVINPAPTPTPTPGTGGLTIQSPAPAGTVGVPYNFTLTAK